MSSEVIIDIHNLSKVFAIFHQPLDRLKQMLWRHHKKFYDEFWALKNISFSISRGETVGLIGRNGAGKSTLLQILCGTLQPTSGNCKVLGRVAALLELGAGFNPEFTGHENIFLAASVLGLSNSEIEARYQSILDFASIGDFINQPVKTYSSGMYARLAFAVATHVDADILIIDEILAVGDASFVQRCMRVIRKFKERGTIIFVSHDLSAVKNLCDRVIWLEDGALREQGEPDAVCHNYLASVFAEKENPDTFRIGGTRRVAQRLENKTAVVEDPRHEALSSGGVSGKATIFDFDPNASWFGKRGATITDVFLLDQTGARFAVIEGGEIATLQISVRAEQDLSGIIAGFYVKDRMGQYLFGDNTFLTYRDSPVEIISGKTVAANFTFQMPYLPSGDFSVVAAVAEGTQEDHQQHHWIEDALIFKVTSSFVSRGLVGIPMINIKLSEIDGV